MKKIMATLLILSMGISFPAMSFQNREQAGSLIGAVVGGVVGNRFGRGDGNALATFIGVVAGAAIGSSLGKSMDEADQKALSEAQSEALESDPGTEVRWNGSDYGSRTGSKGRIQVLGKGHHKRYTQEDCTYYRSEIISGGKREVIEETACYKSNGRWEKVRKEEVYLY